MIDKAQEYIWSTARVLEQRRFEVLFKDGDPARRQGRAGALQDRRRRLRVRAGARRARADEPAAAHLDRAGGAGGRGRDRPGRRATTWRRSPRPTAACRSRCRSWSRGRARRGGASGPRARCSRPRCCTRRCRGEHPWLATRRGVLLDARSTRSRRRTRTRSRRRSRSSTRRRTATARRGGASGSGAGARAGARRHAARGLLAGRDPPPARLRQAPDSLARAWFTDAEIEASLDQLESRAARGRRLARSRGRCGRPRSRSSGAGW